MHGIVACRIQGMPNPAARGSVRVYETGCSTLGCIGLDGRRHTAGCRAGMGQCRVRRVLLTGHRPRRATIGGRPVVAVVARPMQRVMPSALGAKPPNTVPMAWHVPLGKPLGDPALGRSVHTNVGDVSDVANDTRW